jgi:hypothetical protein
MRLLGTVLFIPLLSRVSCYKRFNKFHLIANFSKIKMSQSEVDAAAIAASTDPGKELNIYYHTLQNITYSNFV